MIRPIFEISAAYLLDLIFGDPHWHWHPTRIIGRSIEKLEPKLNVPGINKRFAGVMLIILIVGITVFCVWAILGLVKLVHPAFYYIFSVLFIYFALSVKDLGIEAHKVYQALKDKDLKQARKSLSLIVARDTDTLDEKEIIRATVETVAESIMDGIVSVFFYLFLGGPVLAWAYKAVNTLDSMVGYRSERFIDFGKPTAKLDGLMNFIPARLTAFFIFISSLLYGKNRQGSIKWAVRYSFRGPQVNSELTEAVMAGALGVQLGGLNFYKSVPCAKPLMGDELNPLEIRHIKESIKISYLCSGLAVTSGIFFIWIMGRR
ncbi:MAG: adenosylcobinamide-phosphate synthase CbiB [Patescibacteria group bacterium]